MQILTIPNPILYTKAQEVTEWAEIPSLVDVMIETAIGANLAGLAANQVGILQRVFVVNFGADDAPDFREFVNPKITLNKGRGQSWEFEGCGSIPNMAYLIERWNSVMITAQNKLGENFSYSLSGHLARVVQHEENHLQGITLNKKKFREMRIVK